MKKHRTGGRVDLMLVPVGLLMVRWALECSLPEPAGLERNLVTFLADLV